MSDAQKSKGLPDLSQAELTVLRPLWRKPGLSVRDVHDQVFPDTSWAYTTTKTVMDRMVSKGLLVRERVSGTYVYKAQITKPAGLARMVRFFADRILETDGLAVVNMMKGTGSLSEAELDELAHLVDSDNDAEEGSKK